jgi:hypothetical protein
MERESIAVISAHEIILFNEAFFQRLLLQEAQKPHITLMNAIVSRYCRSSDPARVNSFKFADFSFQHALTWSQAR